MERILDDFVEENVDVLAEMTWALDRLYHTKSASAPPRSALPVVPDFLGLDPTLQVTVLTQNRPVQPNI